MRGPQSSAKTIQPLPPHTTTLGYGHPGNISNTPPPLATQPTLYQSYSGRVPTPQPTPYQSYASFVPPTPYSHHASFAYGNQSKFRRALNLAEVVMRLSNRESFF
jgi:hypothetical protein